MQATRNKQRCPPQCSDHVFNLQNLKGDHKFDIRVSFCPKFRRDPHPPERTIPEYHLDGKYYTNAFVLGTEKKTAVSNAQQQKIHFQTMTKDACEKNNQILFPRPNEKNTYCSVCKEHYLNYFEHINCLTHREKIEAAIYNSEIKKLCEFYRDKWDGCHAKADKIMSDIVRENQELLKTQKKGSELANENQPQDLDNYGEEIDEETPLNNDEQNEEEDESENDGQQYEEEEDSEEERKYRKRGRRRGQIHEPNLKNKRDSILQPARISDDQTPEHPEIHEEDSHEQVQNRQELKRSDSIQNLHQMSSVSRNQRNEEVRHSIQQAHFNNYNKLILDDENVRAAQELQKRKLEQLKSGFRDSRINKEDNKGKKGKKQKQKDKGGVMPESHDKIPGTDMIGKQLIDGKLPENTKVEIPQILKKEMEQKNQLTLFMKRNKNGQWQVIGGDIKEYFKKVQAETQHKNQTLSHKKDHTIKEKPISYQPASKLQLPQKNQSSNSNINNQIHCSNYFNRQSQKKSHSYSSYDDREGGGSIDSIMRRYQPADKPNLFETISDKMQLKQNKQAEKDQLAANQKNYERPQSSADPQPSAPIKADLQGMPPFPMSYGQYYPYYGMHPGNMQPRMGQQQGQIPSGYQSQPYGNKNGKQYEQGSYSQSTDNSKRYPMMPGMMPPYNDPRFMPPRADKKIENQANQKSQQGGSGMPYPYWMPPNPYMMPHPSMMRQPSGSNEQKMPSYPYGYPQGGPSANNAYGMYMPYSPYMGYPYMRKPDNPSDRDNSKK